MTLPDTSTGVLGESHEAQGLNVPMLMAALIPQVISLLTLVGVVPLGGLVAVIVAAAGVLAIVAYRQYAARVAERPGYERSRLLHRAMAGAVVSSLVLLVLAVVPFALDTATGACACG